MPFWQSLTILAMQGALLYLTPHTNIQSIHPLIAPQCYTNLRWRFFKTQDYQFLCLKILSLSLSMSCFSLSRLLGWCPWASYRCTDPNFSDSPLEYGNSCLSLDKNCHILYNCVSPCPDCLVDVHEHGSVAFAVDTTMWVALYFLTNTKGIHKI